MKSERKRSSSARLYCGSALSFDVSRAVSIVAGGIAFVVLFWLYMLACSVGLAGGN